MQGRRPCGVVGEFTRSLRFGVLDGFEPPRPRPLATVCPSCPRRGAAPFSSLGVPPCGMGGSPEKIPSTGGGGGLRSLHRSAAVAQRRVVGFRFQTLLSPFLSKGGTGDPGSFRHLRLMSQ